MQELETACGLDRLLTLKFAVKNSIHYEGDILECGVWKGGTASRIANTINGKGKSLYLVDSFCGFGPRSKEDNTYDNVFSENSFEDVSSKFSEYSFVKFFKGFIPDVFKEMPDFKICFAHVDVDLYQPTKDSLEFIWPRLSVGGSIIVDDYNCSQCQGCNIAVDNFLKNKKVYAEIPFYNSTIIITKLGNI